MRIREGDPSQNTLEWWERFCSGILELAGWGGWEHTQAEPIPAEGRGGLHSAAGAGMIKTTSVRRCV